jgi:hypothetical protein
MPTLRIPGATAVLPAVLAFTYIHVIPVAKRVPQRRKHLSCIPSFGACSNICISLSLRHGAISRQDAPVNLTLMISAIPSLRVFLLASAVRPGYESQGTGGQAGSHKNGVTK